MDFFSRLNYSIGNEDWLVEEQALKVQAGDNVVCVTASGDRSLHLLMTDCQKIFSIDMNQAQNSLLDLKLAAITRLDYEKYLGFLGCEPCPNRGQIYNELKPFLSKQSNAFWDRYARLIDKGIIYQGRTERLTQLTAKFFNLTRKKKIKKLFELDNIEDQKHFVKNAWDTKALRLLFEVIINPKLSQFLLKDPGLNSFVDHQPGQYIYNKMINYLNTDLAQKSPLLQLLFTGKILPQAYFPYLTYDGYKAIRRNPHRVTVIEGNIIDLMKSENFQNQIDCFSISDIASYMPQNVFEELLRSIHHAAKPNARFCLREFMSNRKIPQELIPAYKRDNYLEKKLEKEETNFVYRFIAGEIQK